MCLQGPVPGDKPCRSSKRTVAAHLTFNITATYMRRSLVILDVRHTDSLVARYLEAKQLVTIVSIARLRRTSGSHLV